jgi:hypothetical protein
MWQNGMRHPRAERAALVTTFLLHAETYHGAMYGNRAGKLNFGPSRGITDRVG